MRIAASMIKLGNAIVASYVPQAQKQSRLFGLYINRQLQRERLRSSTSILATNAVRLTGWIHTDAAKRYTGDNQWWDSGGSRELVLGKSG